MVIVNYFYVLVNTETMKILALEVTDDSVGDSSMFCQLLGQVVGAERPKASGNNSSITEYESLLTSEKQLTIARLSP